MTSSEAWTLRLGGFDFSPEARDDCEVQVLTFRRGKPEMVTKVVESGIEDGVIEQLVRHGNRDQPLLVGFKASDAQVLAQVEEELILECAKARNELAWTPPDGFGATSVYDVVTAEPEFVEDGDWDLDELDGYRIWQVTFRSLSFARAETLTQIAGLTVGAGSDTPIDACDAVGSWTATRGTLSLDTARKFEGTGSLKVTASSAEYSAYDGSSYYRQTTRTEVSRPLSAVNFSTTPYLSIKVDNQFAESVTVEASVDGVAATPVAAVSLPDGWKCYTFRTVDASASVVVFSIVRTQVVYLPSVGYPNPDSSTRFDDVRRGPSVLGVGSTTGRESLRLVQVNGSARTPASLLVEHATLGIGKALVYTNPAMTAGDTPDMMRWWVSGSGDSADATGISGIFRDVGTSSPEVFRKPLDPMYRGGYLLLARAKSGPFTDVQLTASTRLSTGALIGTRVSRNRNVQTVNGFAILGDLTLPVADVPPGSNAQLELQVLSTAAGAVQYEDLFLCPMGEGAALTLVDCGAGTTATLGSANNRLWIDSASIERPAPAVWVGSAEGKADAYIATNAWRMSHQFAPGSVLVFLANTGGANPGVSASYFEKAHTNMVKRS